MPFLVNEVVTYAAVDVTDGDLAIILDFYQRNTPREFRGRVFSAFFVSSLPGKGDVTGAAIVSAFRALSLSPICA